MKNNDTKVLLLNAYPQHTIKMSLIYNINVAKLKLFGTPQWKFHCVKVQLTMTCDKCHEKLIIDVKSMLFKQY